MEAPKYICSRHGCNAKSIVAVAEGCGGLCTAQSYAHDQGMEIRNITLLSMQVSAPNNTAIDSTAAAAASGGSGGGGGSVDLATIGKGIGGPPLMSRSPPDPFSTNPFWAWASKGPVVDSDPTVPDRVTNLACPERREHHFVLTCKDLSCWHPYLFCQATAADYRCTPCNGTWIPPSCCMSAVADADR